MRRPGLRLRLLQMVLGLDRLDGAFSRDVVRHAARLQPSPLHPPHPPTPLPIATTTATTATTHTYTHRHPPNSSHLLTHPTSSTSATPTPPPHAPSPGPWRRLPCGRHRRGHVGPGGAALRAYCAERRRRWRCALLRRLSRLGRARAEPHSRPASSPTPPHLFTPTPLPAMAPAPALRPHVFTPPPGPPYHTLTRRPLLRRLRRGHTSRGRGLTLHWLRRRAARVRLERPSR